MKKLLILSWLVFIIVIASLYTDSVTYASCRKQSIAIKFQKEKGFLKGRKGYIIDHVCALACGGLDVPSNMQYQTYLESKKKDRWERTAKGCEITCNPSNSLPERTVFNCKK